MPHVNVFFLIALGAIVLDYLAGLIADLLNLGSLADEPPVELAGLYKPDEYRKSQEYTRATTRLGIAASTFQLAVLLAFWLAGGFVALRVLANSVGTNQIVAGIVYVAVFAGGYLVLSLPFSVYSTFKVENRFGFNRTTPSLFILDQMKGAALAVIIGVPVLAVVLLLFQRGGNAAWLYCWAAVTAITLILQYVAPTWIMPLFNRYQPLPDGELRSAILAYTKRYRFEMENIYVMDGSKRSSKSNAFFTGFGRHKRIVLFDTLIASHTVPQLVAVLAHETGHYKKRHILTGTLIGIAHTGVLLFIASFFVRNLALHEAFGISVPAVYTGLLLFGLLYAPVEFFLSPLLLWMSRRNEHAADRFALETVEDPAYLDGALRKLAAHNLTNLTPSPFFVLTHYSHPPLQARLRSIASWMEDRRSKKSRS